MKQPSRCYLAGGNLLWLNFQALTSPYVPINMSAVNNLKQYFFAKPVARFPETVSVGAAAQLPVRNCILVGRALA